MTIASPDAARDASRTVRIRRLAVIGNEAFSMINFRGSLLRDLRARGIRVYALAPGFRRDLRRQVTDLGAVPVEISLARAGMNPARDAIDFLRLVRTLRHLGPDATLCYFIKPIIYGSFAARLVGVPRLFAMIEGIGFPFGRAEDGGARERFLRPTVATLYRRALKHAERVFILNPDDERVLVESGLVDAGKLTRLPGIGVDLERFQPVASPPLPVTFSLVGRLLREKGIREYVAAARIVKEHRSEVRFLLLGDVDPNPRSLKRRTIQAWAEEGIVEWPGWVADVRPWLARSSVFVLPSYREGVPRSTQEAMAMARPVITTDAPGCRETVVEGENGFLVPPRDPQALAEAMLQYVREPELIPKMGAASRRLAEHRFDVHKVNRLILDAMGL